MVEILVAHKWTRAKGDTVSLSVGQTIDVPESVESSMVASGLAKSIPRPLPPPPVVAAAGTESKAKSKKAGGK